MIDYLGFILLKTLGPVLRKLPISLVLFLGRRLGELFYLFDPKHRAIAYANLKIAFGKKMPPVDLGRLAKQSYRAFGQNFIEIFLMPKIGRAYVDKHIAPNGLKSIREGLGRGKGVILVGVHAGNWELANTVCTAFGFPFMMFVRDQRYPHLDGLLNSYRTQKGMEIIARKNGARALVQALKDNKIVGMTLDQGGKAGRGIEFFGKDASMATGAIKLALRYDAALVLGFPARVNGPYTNAFFEPYFLKKSGEFDNDVRDNLQAIIRRFEKYISEYPQEYLWRYRIWKYSKTRQILILSDGRTGHLRQAQAVADIAVKQLAQKDIRVKIDTVEIGFKNKFSRIALAAGTCLGGKYQCQGCAWCLRAFLDKDTDDSLAALNPDIVISAGSSVAPVNFVVSRQSMAKSICIMRPAHLGAGKFDLVIMPKHDRPARRENVVVTQGALNLIDDWYLKTQAEKIALGLGLKPSSRRFVMGLLIGGDAKGFQLPIESVRLLMRQVKSAAEELNLDILLTTSRRTPQDVDKLVKEELRAYPWCKLCVIANERNIPEAVGAILGLSEIVIVSAESISMVSEAASSGKYVLVFGAAAVKGKHRRFLDELADKKYIYIVAEKDLAVTIKRVLSERPQIRVLNDRELVSKAISKIL